jgi:Aldehyde dehydrogenase family
MDLKLYIVSKARLIAQWLARAGKVFIPIDKTREISGEQSLGALGATLSFSLVHIVTGHTRHPNNRGSSTASLLVDRFHIGNPDVDGKVMGPLVDKIQFDRVHGSIERGTRQVQLLTGGQKKEGKGFFVEPIVFTMWLQMLKYIRLPSFQAPFL